MFSHHLLFGSHNMKKFLSHTLHITMFFYKEDFIEKSTELHLFTYYSQPTTKKKKKENTLQKRIMKC